MIHVEAKDLHPKQKSGKSWSKLVALGQWGKLVTIVPAIRYLANFLMVSVYMYISHMTHCDKFYTLGDQLRPISRNIVRIPQQITGTYG